VAGFLIDANLPYRWDIWTGVHFQHVFDLGDDLPDRAIWEHARLNDLVIVTKDSDFSDWIMLSDPPPRVIHLRIGNLRLREFKNFVERIWPEVQASIAHHKLVIVFPDAIECVA
jgi:predicted nuclease of predicted toxin-antitoxin system